VSGPLAQRQRDFAAWLTAREAPAETPGLLSDARASAAQRLRVYRDAYAARIVSALRDDYPALCGALGQERFDALAREYLHVFPSRHPSLRYAGARLPEFIVGHAAARELGASAAWAADLARLELAVTDAFDAADAQPLTRTDLGALPPGSWHALELALMPGALLLALGRPVRALRAAHDAAQPLAQAARAALAPLAERVLVWRSGERVLHREVGAEEHALLACVVRGVRFGELCALAAEARGDEAGAALAASLLARWVDDALLRSAAA
jgi:hypothetical protein